MLDEATGRRAGSGASEGQLRVQRIFIAVLALNLSVALAKAVFGILAGSVSMVADAVHSGFDSFSNVVGIVALYFAEKPPDPEHPYGHGKIETLGTLAIGAMLLLSAAGIFFEGYQRLVSPAAPDITAVTIGVMLGTLVVNIAVSTYERKKVRSTRARSSLPTPSIPEATSSSRSPCSGDFLRRGSGFRRPTRSSRSPSAS